MKRNNKIYMHKNKINGKVYIGQTYTDLKQRFGNGKYYSGCPKFYNAIKKYGWNNFDHILLEENIATEKEANEKEIYYIDKYNSTDSAFGYNIQSGGHEQTALSISVYKYDLNGNYIEEYNSIADANRDNNISNGKISECCNGKRKSAGGYMWSYEKVDKLKKYYKSTKSKPVHQYSLSGYYIKTYDKLSDVIKEFDLLNGAHISNCCNGNRETAYGYMWSYEKHKNIEHAKNTHKQGVGVVQYGKDGGFIARFNNRTEASEQFGDNSKKAYFAISNCLNNKSKSAYGYYWKYDL